MLTNPQLSIAERASANAFDRLARSIIASTTVTNATITAAQAFVLPSASRCVDRGTFVIRLKRPGDVRYLAASVKVNGRRVSVLVAGQRYRTIRGSTVPGSGLTARVAAGQLPTSTFTVQMTAVTRSLRTIRATRRYRTCSH